MGTNTENKKLIVSKRLQALTDMVTPGNRVVDVGCDHGFAAIRLIQQGISPRVIAMDVREGPLRAAREHIAEWQLEDYIETRLSDGLSAYRAGEAQTLLCAGMGGPLMMRILKDGAEKITTMRELILQPQSQLQSFRCFLREEGYRVLEENILWEEEKYYFLFRASLQDSPGRVRAAVAEKSLAPPDADGLQEVYDKYGYLPLQRRDPILLQFLQRSLRTVEQISGKLGENQTDRGRIRFAQMEKEKADLQKALRFYEE